MATTIIDTMFYVLFLLCIISQIFKDGGLKKYFKKTPNICDVCVFCLCTSGLIYEFCVGFTLTPTDHITTGFRTFKYFRLFIMLSTSPLLS